MGWFWFSDSGYRFEKLNQFDIFFFALILFPISSFKVIYLKKWASQFFFQSGYLDLDNMFGYLTWVFF